MLKIIIEPTESYNEETETFSTLDDEVVVELEHSLLSLSKWESKFKKPFLAIGQKTSEEIFEYIKFMVTTPGLDPDVLNNCSQKNINQIQEYIDSSESATTFGIMPERRGRGEVITAELIYYWMITFNIPVKFEEWHLNRLFALIKIFNIKNSKQKKVSRHEMAQRNRDLNAQRKAQLGTSG